MNKTRRLRTVRDFINTWDWNHSGQEEQNDRFLSIREACEYLHLHPNTMYKIIAEDDDLRVYDLKTGRTGKACYRLLKSDIDDWLAGRQT